MSEIETIKIFMPYTNGEREVSIYLPDSYCKNSKKKYPVLYMHDGQNVFLDKKAYDGCWGVIEGAKEAVGGDKARECIIVCLDNDAEKRFNDYSPWKNVVGTEFMSVGEQGGDGDLYADFFVEKLLPFINSKYRTLSDKENTALAGGSMGGFITAYIMAKYPQYFTKAGIFSMAGWFAEEEFLKYVAQSEGISGGKYFLQVGTMETVDSEMKEMPQMFIDSTLKYCRVLLEKGIPIQNIMLNIGAGHDHSERSWKTYMKPFFEFIYPR